MDEREKREEIAAIRRLQREIDARTRSGAVQHDSDIFDLDRRLMEAELRWPGSTLPLYFERYRPAWILGVALMVVGIAVLALGDAVGPGAVATGIGSVLILGPVAAWYQSRPRRRSEA
jgi:hypothetical protein